MKKTNERWLTAASLAAAGLLVVALGWMVVGGRSPRDAEEPLPVLWDIPAFSFSDQNNNVVTPASLKGQVWIADFIFTQCTTACPVMTARMVLLQRALEGRAVKFVSFSVDPENDTPAVLKTYASQWGADEKRWHLLATVDQPTLTKTVAEMHVGVEKNDDPKNPILHTSKFMLVDATSRVRNFYDSNDEESMTELVRHASELAGAAQPVVTAAHVEGRELFASVGCMACHAKETIAPRLEGIAGQPVKLADGRIVTADEAYLRESIINPAAKIVQGYGPSMPAYRGHLSDAQVTALVQYISTTKAPAAAAAERELIVDIVCGMEVSAGEGTPSAVHDGKTYHFCSDHCRKRFEADPVTLLNRKPEDRGMGK